MGMLLWAFCRSGNLNMIRLLIEAGADVNGKASVQKRTLLKSVSCLPELWRLTCIFMVIDKFYDSFQSDLYNLIDIFHIHIWGKNQTISLMAHGLKLLTFYTRHINCFHPANIFTMSSLSVSFYGISACTWR